MRCVRCNGRLRPFYESAHGVRLQVVSCMACGWRISREDPVGKKRRAVRDALVCVAESADFAPCPIEGCDGRLGPNNQIGLCNRCGNRQRNWTKGAKLGPAPFVKDCNGRWMKNPALEAGRKAAAWRPCIVEGCSGRSVVRAGVSGFCRKCSMRMTRWRATLRTKPAPFVEIAPGRWVINEARAQG